MKALEGKQVAARRQGNPKDAVFETDADERERAQKLQVRINAVLAEPAEEAASQFSPYGNNVEKPNFARRLVEAAAAGGVKGIEDALAEFDRLWEKEDKKRLRYALMVFLTHHPDANALGLRIPSLEERSPWKATPSKKEKGKG